jgi:hypothetical protein
VPDAQGGLAARNRRRGTQRSAEAVDGPLGRVLAGLAYEAAVPGAAAVGPGPQPAGRAVSRYMVPGQSGAEAARLSGQQRRRVSSAREGDGVAEMASAQQQPAVRLTAIAGAENTRQPVVLRADRGQADHARR